LKVLIVGNGGREHAMAWKIAQNSAVEKIYCAPGNGGTVLENKCSNLELTKTEDLIEFAKNNGIALTVIGPELNLTKGIVDEFKAAGLCIFGPSKEAAQLEGSKVFAKNFMKKYGVKTATYEVFEDKDKAIEYLTNCGYPIVIKAEGLAAGKGVVICETFEEAHKTICNLMVEDILIGSGKRIVIEEYLEGVEASILAITDGEVIIPFISAKDHKQIYAGGKGPNTGGMGVIAPNPYCTEEILKAFENDIMLPTLEGIKKEKMDYTGIVFFGLMITNRGVYNLEYNVRMGDPEAQALLTLMESDFLNLIVAAINKKLMGTQICWNKGHACCVIAASAGYPGDYKTSYEITGLNYIKANAFISGGRYSKGKLLTCGGRVLALVSVEDSLEIAREKAYEQMNLIDFEGIYFRRDIGE